MAMPDYIPAHDKKMATRLVDEALRRGYTISVNDGEEWTVKRSTVRAEILAAMGSTEMDVIKVREKPAEEGDVAKFVGCFDLVWNNDPGDTIADHTANAECESLYAHAAQPFN